MNKQKLIDQLINILQKEEKISAEASSSAREAAAETEAKPENQYDTRALEQSYLADGQARRRMELLQSIQRLQTYPLVKFDEDSTIDLSALVTLETEDGELKTYLVLPERGGIRLAAEDKEIFTLSPETSLGQLLMGKALGESIELKLKGEARSFTIVGLE